MELFNFNNYFHPYPVSITRGNTCLKLTRGNINDQG